MLHEMYTTYKRDQSSFLADRLKVTTFVQFFQFSSIMIWHWDTNIIPPPGIVSVNHTSFN